MKSTKSGFWQLVCRSVKLLCRSSDFWSFKIVNEFRCCFQGLVLTLFVFFFVFMACFCVVILLSFAILLFFNWNS